MKTDTSNDYLYSPDYIHNYFNQSTAAPDAAPSGTLNEIAKGAALGVGGLVNSVSRLGNDLYGASGGNKADDDYFQQATSLHSTTGEISKGISQFALAFIPVNAAVGLAGEAAGIGAYAKTLHTVSGLATDAIAFDGRQERLSNLLNDHLPSLKNPVTDFLAADPNDGWAEARLKNAIEGSGIGFLGGLLFKSIGLHKAIASGDAEAIASKWKDAAEEIKTVAKADELRQQIKAVAPQITDQQIDHGLTLHVLVGKELGKSAQEALDHIKEVVAHDGSDIEGLLTQKAGREGFAKAQRDMADAEIRQYLDEKSMNPDARAGKGVLPTKPSPYGVNDPVPASTPAAPAGEPPIPLEEAPAKTGIPVEPTASATVNPNAVPLKDGLSPTETPIKPGATPASGLRPPTESVGGIPLKSDARVPDPNALPLASATDPIVKGYTKFLSDTQAIIGLHNTADVSTFLHESFHLFRRFGLSSETETALKSALGVPAEAAWSRELEEKAARLFERWWYDGKAPNDTLAPAFQQAREWMLAVYHSVDSSEIAGEVSPEVRNVFSNMLGAAPAEAGSLDAVAKSAADAQAKAMTNDPALYLAQKQGSPVPAELVNKIKQTVADRVASGATLGKAAEDGLAYLNFSKIDASTDVKGLIQQVQEMIQGPVGKGVDGVVSWKTTYETAQELAAEIGTSTDKALKFLKNKSVATADLHTQAVASRAVRNQFAMALQDIAQQAERNPTNSTLSKLFDDKWQAYANAAKYAKQIQTNIGRALSSFNIKVGGIDAGFEDSLANVEKLLNGGDSLIARRLFYKQLIGARDSNAINNLISHVGDRFASLGKRALSLHDEMWINALLSGPKTQLTNIVSQSMMTAIQPAERIVGGLLRGDLEMAARGVKLYANLVGSALDIFHVGRMGFANEESSIGRAWKAMLEEQPILNQMTKTSEGPQFAWSAQNLGLKQGAFHANAVDALGKLIRLPTRMLTGVDEFFKQINYRAYLRDEAINEAQRLGIKDAGEMAGFVGKFMRDGFTDSGAAKYDPALLMAQRATFTQDLVEGSLSSDLSKLASRHPLVRNIVPFVKVPVNIMKTFRDYTPGLNILFKEFRDQLTHPDSAIRSSAWGRLALGGAFWTAAYGHAAAGHLTGNGPSDPKLKQALMDTGWQPQSFVMDTPNGKKYISYKRLEPFAMILGLVADYHEASQWMDEDTKNATATAMLMPIAKNLVNKTYLKGLSDVLDAIESPDSKGEKFAQARLSSEVPYSGLLGQVNQDETLRDTRTFMDGVLQRLPGYSSKLPPKRNLFGEPIVVPNRINPFTESDSVSDPVRNELANLRYAFSGPGKNYRGIDLSTLKNEQGQDAYDRLQELHGQVQVGGKTLPQALERLITSQRYQSFPQPSAPGDQNNPRVLEVQRVLGQYRERATHQMLREYPQVGQQFRALQQQARQERMTPVLQRLLASQQ